MFPILYKIGPLTFHTYGLFVALGVFAGIKIAVWLAERDGFKSKEIEESLYSLFFYFVMGGLLGGRLLYVLVHWDEFSGDSAGIFKIWQGGLVSYGGLSGALAGFLIWHKKNWALPWKKIADWLSPSIAFGHALGRLGCFSAGCCYGKPTEEPWSVVFTDPLSLAPLGIPLHPTQIYEFVFLVLLGVFLLMRLAHLMKSATRIDGIVFADYLALYSAGRFCIEFFRNDDPRFWGLTPGQIASLLTFAASIFLRMRLIPRLDQKVS